MYTCAELAYYESYWRGVANYHEAQEAAADATADDFHQQWENQNCGQSFGAEEEKKDSDKLLEDFKQHMQDAEAKFRKQHGIPDA